MGCRGRRWRYFRLLGGVYSDRQRITLGALAFETLLLLWELTRLCFIDAAILFAASVCTNLLVYGRVVRLSPFRSASLFDGRNFASVEVFVLYAYCLIFSGFRRVRRDRAYISVPASPFVPNLFVAASSKVVDSCRRPGIFVFASMNDRADVST